MYKFGSKCYTLENVKKGKLDDRGKMGVFLGYDTQSPAYFVYYPESQTVGKSRVVRVTNTLYNQRNQINSPRGSSEEKIVVELPIKDDAVSDDDMIEPIREENTAPPTDDEADDASVTHKEFEHKQKGSISMMLFTG